MMMLMAVIVIMLMFVRMHRGEGQAMFLAKFLIAARGVAIPVARTVFHPAPVPLHSFRTRPVVVYRQRPRLHSSHIPLSRMPSSA